MKIRRKNEQKSHKNKIKDCIFKDKERDEKGKKGKERILKLKNKIRDCVFKNKARNEKGKKGRK